jgi:hypothetical protein
LRRLSARTLGVARALNLFHKACANAHDGGFDHWRIPMAHPLFKLLSDLDIASIHYTIARDRPDTVRVNVTVAGERVEIDVFEDGHMELSRFRGSEGIVGDAAMIETLIAEHRN